MALAAAAGSGILLSVANPPADVGAVAFFALTPLLWALSGSPRPRRGALIGFVFGLVYYGILLEWLRTFGVIAWLPLVASQAAYASVFGALLPRLWRNGRPIRSAVQAAALWTALDWARATWPAGGFGWGGFGYTQHGNRFLLPLASVTGVWGVTFVVVLVNGLLLGAILRMGERGRAPHERVRSASALPVIGLAAVLLPAAIPVPAANGRPLDVAVVQGNVSLSLASDPYLQSDVVVGSHIALTRTLAGNPPDLVVWPENALYADPTQDPALGRAVGDAIRAVGASALVGAVSPTSNGRFFNQTLFYSGGGEVIGRYTKVHLVPFGEYVPWPAVFRWTERYRRGNADLVPGHALKVFQVDGASVAAPICFENVFPDLFRRFVADGAGLVVLTTNDSSFLRSPASREHVIMSQLRAVENGRWVVHAAISGQSAIIDPRGQVIRRTGLFQTAILRDRVPTSQGTTLYTRLGDWFPWACGLAVATILLATALARRRREDGSPGPDAPSAPPAGERSARTPLPISGGSDPRTMVVLPTYNERPTVATVIEGVLAVRPTVDVLVIDDGSPDGTGEVVAALAKDQPRIRLLRRDGKQGLASAYLLGFRTALDQGYGIVVEMDADLSHRPDELERLLAGSETYDLTIGSRYVDGGGVTNWSRSRLALSKAGNAYARTVLALPVTDATSGYRAYRRQLLEALLADGISSDGYAFQVELAYRAWRQGFAVGEVPITFQEREHGRSKLSRRIVVEALWRIAAWGVRDRMGSGRRAATSAGNPGRSSP